MLGELSFFALPAPLFRYLTDAATARGMTLAQLLSEAVSRYIKETPEIKK